MDTNAPRGAANARSAALIVDSQETASRFRHETLGMQPFRYRLKSRGRPFICARIRNLRSRVLPRRASSRERLSGHPPCIGATATRHRAARIAGSLGTGEIADMAVVGEGCRH
jgi:hypothetical protein